MFDGIVGKQVSAYKVGMLSKGIGFLLRNNGCSHVSNQTQKLVGSLAWEQLEQPPNSPNLVASDYHVLLY